MVDGWTQCPSGWNEVDKLTIPVHTPQKDNLILNITPDAIFVLGGGLQDDGNVYEWVVRRLDLAVKLYALYKTKIIVQGGGTYHKPPILNKKKYVIHESTACAEYLIDQKIPPNDIYREWASYDTIANGYFAFTNYILPLNYKNIVVITSEFHMPRTKFIYDKLSELTTHPVIEYCCANDIGLNLTARINREQSSLLTLKQIFNTLHSLPDFTQWLFEKHQAYASNCERERKEYVDEEIKKTY